MTDAPPPYPGITGNSGYAAPSSHTNGAAGGIQTGYYDPNNPQMGFVPPPPLPSAVSANVIQKQTFCPIKVRMFGSNVYISFIRKEGKFVEFP